MIKIILLFLLTINLLLAQDEKKYISTIGQRIEIVDDVIKSNPTSLYAITDVQQKNILLSSINNFCKKDSSGKSILFNFLVMQLNNTDYKTHRCYVLMTQLSNDVEINQPYHYAGSNELIFEITKGKYQEQHYCYIRTYKVKIEEDIFDKYILEDDKKIKLTAIIL